MEKQDKRYLEIDQKESVATTVQALQHDVSSIKDVLQSRITAAEKVHTAKTAILDEFMAELEGRFCYQTQLETELSNAKAAHAPTLLNLFPCITLLETLLRHLLREEGIISQN